MEDLKQGLRHSGLQVQYSLSSFIGMDQTGQRLSGMKLMLRLSQVRHLEDSAETWSLEMVRANFRIRAISICQGSLTTGEPTQSSGSQSQSAGLLMEVMCSPLTLHMRVWEEWTQLRSWWWTYGHLLSVHGVTISIPQSSLSLHSMTMLRYGHTTVGPKALITCGLMSSTHSTIQDGRRATIGASMEIDALSLGIMFSQWTERWISDLTGGHILQLKLQKLKTSSPNEWLSLNFD